MAGWFPGSSWLPRGAGREPEAPNLSWCSPPQRFHASWRFRRGVLALLAFALVATSAGRTAAASSVPEEEPVTPVVGVGVLSKSSNVAQRDLLRETWFTLPAVRRGALVPRFFVARPTDAHALTRLEQERDLHADIEVVPVDEGYANVTHQTFAALRFFSRDASPERKPPLFVVKTDDDVFVRADALVSHLSRLTTNHSGKVPAIYGGWLVNGAKPHRNGKWKVSKAEYAGEDFPTYASGPTHFMSFRLARRIVRRIDSLGSKAPWLRLEDVSVGLWVKEASGQAKVHLEDDRRFHKGRLCEPWAVAVLIEQGRPLLFSFADVQNAFFSLLASETKLSATHPAAESVPRSAAESVPLEEARGDGPASGLGGPPREGECPEGTSLEEVKARRACEQERKVDSRSPAALSCAPWLVAAQRKARGEAVGARVDLHNLYPGGNAQIQVAAEGAVVEEAVKARADWHVRQAAAGVAVDGGKAASDSSKEIPRVESKGSPKKLVVRVMDAGMREYHPFLAATGRQLCQVPCTFRNATHLPDSRHHVELFLGDLEVYMKAPGTRKLPKKQKGAVRALAFREALSKFPQGAWAKYDLNVTYRVDSPDALVFSSGVKTATYGYLESFDVLLEEAAAAPGRDDRGVLMAAVALRCGAKGAKGDGRWERTRLIQELSKHMQVASYGACANNAKWPPGAERDKMVVMRGARFCLAFENSKDEDYVTEKLFDCLRAGAVPVVSGGDHLRRFAPPGGTVFIDDFATPALLATHLVALDKDPAALAKMYEWVSLAQEHDKAPVGIREWIALLRSSEAVGARCRVCEKAASLLGFSWPEFSEKPPWTEQERRRVWGKEARRVAADDDLARIGKSHASRVKVEL